MAGCLPLSQWLSIPARSLVSDPTRSQSRRTRSLAAASTLAAMCAGATWRSDRVAASSGGRAPCQVDWLYLSSCHGDTASIVIRSAADPTLSCALLYLSFGLLT